MIPAFIADRENRKRRGEFDQEHRIGAEIGHTCDDFYEDEDDFDEDEVVYETKGSSPPPPPSPMEEARAQMELERMRHALQQEVAERERQRAEAERQERIAKASGKLNQAHGMAQNYGTTQVAARGIDQNLANQYGLLDLYNQALEMARAGIHEEDLNPMASYNTSGMFSDALNTAQGAYRSALNRQLNELAPDDFMYNIFADSADDEILQSILDTQRQDALAQIDSARARGQLNDVGYNRAMQMLNNQSEIGLADLQDLGLGVLSGYRDQLGGLRDNFANKIGMADFSNPLSFDTFQSRLDQTTSDLTNRMRGDLLRATRGQTFFDPSTIISGSGSIQGYYNPTGGTQQKTSSGAANPLLSAFTEDEQNKQTGAPTNGVF